MEFFHGIVTCFAPYYALSYSQSDMKQGDSCEFFSVKGICKIAFLKIPKSVTDEDTVGWRYRKCEKFYTSQEDVQVWSQ